MPDKELEALTEPIEKDMRSSDRSEGKIGKNVKGWLGDFTANAAGGAVINNLPAIVEAIQKVMGG